MRIKRDEDWCDGTGHIGSMAPAAAGELPGAARDTAIVPKPYRRYKAGMTTMLPFCC